MKLVACRFLLVLILGSAVFSCAGPRLTVLYNDRDGLKPGDRVFWDGQTIGKVESIEVDPQGRYPVHLQMDRDMRNRVTDQSRFVIQTDPARKGRAGVKIVQLGEGNPLPEGATVEGSTEASLNLERRGLGSLADSFLKELDRLQKEIGGLFAPDRLRELERQIREWTRLLEKSGTEVRRWVREQVLPALEGIVREMERILRSEGKSRDAARLEQEFKDLKRASE